MTLLELLKKNRLFREIPEGVLESMSQRMVQRNFERGELVQGAQMACEQLVLVLEGSILLMSTDVDTGLEFTVEQIHVGEILGASEIITGEPFGMVARTASPTRTSILTAPLFRQLFKVPEVGALIARELAREVNQLRRQASFRFVDLSRQTFRPEVYQLIPTPVLARHKAIPLRVMGDRLLVGMVDPTDRAAVDDLQRSARGYTVEPAGIHEEGYKAFLPKPPPPPRVELSSLQRPGEQATRPVRPDVMPLMTIEYLSGEPQSDTMRASAVVGQEVVRMVSQILSDGVTREASDIHIEPSADKAQVRYRIDGQLQKIGAPIPGEYHVALLARLKVLAKLDIAERRMPQEGRFSIKANRKRLDFRLSIIPSKWGEKAVLRVLDPSNLLGRINRIILHEQTAQMVREMSLRPHGILFITGPTGAGKSTTLYCLLNERTGDSVNVVTIEDPIEYDVPDIVQTQVNENIGLGFDTLLRAFLRQDPDVILVGETRDKVTAKTALEAALTGRFVMTSLHTNSALGAVIRLRDMGMDPFLIANSLVGALGQRLLRRICPHCRTELPGRHVLLDRFNSMAAVEEPLTTTFYGKGCYQCKNTGFDGRVAALEVMRVNDEIKSLIVEGATEGALLEAAMHNGMVPFANYCRFLIAQGQTTVEEALSILTAG